MRRRQLRSTELRLGVWTLTIVSLLELRLRRKVRHCRIGRQSGSDQLVTYQIKTSSSKSSSVVQLPVSRKRRLLIDLKSCAVSKWGVGKTNSWPKGKSPKLVHLTTISVNTS